MRCSRLVWSMMLAAALALGACSRNHSDAPNPPRETPRAEISADASIRLINDPLPAQPPTATADGAAPMIPLGTH